MKKEKKIIKTTIITIGETFDEWKISFLNKIKRKIIRKLNKSGLINPTVKDIIFKIIINS